MYGAVTLPHPWPFILVCTTGHTTAAADDEQECYLPVTRSFQVLIHTISCNQRKRDVIGKFGLSGGRPFPILHCSTCLQPQERVACAGRIDKSPSTCTYCGAEPDQAAH